MSSWLEILLLGMVLSADSFSAAFAMGHRPYARKDAVRFACVSGGAEALSALLGAFSGSAFLARFAAIDHWIAFGLLTAVAMHMAWEGVEQLRRRTPAGLDSRLSATERAGLDPSVSSSQFHGTFRILLVSFATSLDAFGVGVGFGVTGKPMMPFLGSIGIWAFLATLTGLDLSRRLSKKAGPVMTIVGAGVLEIIAILMLKI